MQHMVSQGTREGVYRRRRCHVHTYETSKLVTLGLEEGC
jgi:hypothetical protein